MAVTETGTRAARALDDLYRGHSAEIYRYAYAMLGNRSDAEDVVQTTFMNALRALERGERPRNASSWLVAIAHNVIRQRFRQAQARPTEVALNTEVPAAPAPPDDDTPSLDDVLQALARIPESQREALILREFEGRSYAEIAGILGVSTSALETLLFRARRSLAEELDNRVTCEFAEQAVLRRTDHRLSRKEKRRLGEHIKTCPDCARFEVLQRRQSRALKGLALLPIPASLTLFKGMTDTAAAATLPTIGAATGAATATTAATATGGTGVGGVLGGLFGGGVAVKAATVAATVAVAGGIAGTTVVQTRDKAPAKPLPAASDHGQTTAAAAKAAAVERAEQRAARVAAAKLAAAKKAAEAKKKAAAQKAAAQQKKALAQQKAAAKKAAAGKSATAGSNQPGNASAGGRSGEKASASTGKPETNGKPETSGKPEASGTQKTTDKAATTPPEKKPAKATAEKQQPAAVESRGKPE